MLDKLTRVFFTFFALVISDMANAEQPWSIDNNTRYLAIGDSLTAGEGATPVTNGYAYLLYQQGVYDSMTNTLFNSAAVSGATSDHVRSFEVPLAIESGFLLTGAKQVITMTVGGNDFLDILGYIVINGITDYGTQSALISAARTKFKLNLNKILEALCALPNTRIYIGNLYNIQALQLPVPLFQSVDQTVKNFNDDIINTVAPYASKCAVRIADIYTAFLGSQQGLLLFSRNGAGALQVHPSNAGYRAIAKAFIAVR